mmetsp:Transcript_35386/g.42601  ORF Transcript_35386/g.42601 Transcript_35386/m.42601 type:complete len:98 (+) Transcript_35386:392-685(+)
MSIRTPTSATPAPPPGDVVSKAIFVHVFSSNAPQPLITMFARKRQGFSEWERCRLRSSTDASDSTVSGAPSWNRQLSRGSFATGASLVVRSFLSPTN